jgi:hypothetical protein
MSVPGDAQTIQHIRRHPNMQQPDEKVLRPRQTAFRVRRDLSDPQTRLQPRRQRRKRQRMRMPEMAREITRRWISDVPSKMV